MFKNTFGACRNASSLLRLRLRTGSRRLSSFGAGSSSFGGGGSAGSSSASDAAMKLCDASKSDEALRSYNPR